MEAVIQKSNLVTDVRDLVVRCSRGVSLSISLLGVATSPTTFFLKRAKEKDIDLKISSIVSKINMPYQHSTPYNY